MSVADTISDFITGTYTVTRSALGATVKGRVTETQTTFTISASIQPLGGREIMRLPEGERARERLLVFTVTPLQTGKDPDQLTVNGEPWEVESVEDWSTLGGFYKATVRKAGD